MNGSRVGGLGLAGMVLGLIVLAMPPAAGQTSAVWDRDRRRLIRRTPRHS